MLHADGRAVDAVDLQQRRLDLAGLDAVPAQLHLVVGAAQVDELAVVGPPGQVAAAVEPLPGTKGLATKRAAVRPGRSR
ncbi:hypothetical protein ACFQV8_36735 [Pseudonocardia benzenivorans]